MNKRIVSVVLIMLLGNNLFAQQHISSDLPLQRSNSIATLGEFMRRFNALDIPTTLDAKDNDVKLKCIGSLIELESFQSLPDSVLRTYKQFIIDCSQQNMQLDYTDSLWFAQAVCRVKYKNKEYRINLILKYEPVRNGLFKWSLCGANGLFENGMIDTTLQAISPNENELNFMELRTHINKYYENIVGYKSNDKQIDQLSYFLGLVKSRQITFDVCDYVQYYFFNIPEYMFIVSEYNRLGDNAGWLISSIEEMNDTDKQLYIDKLLGKLR